MLIFVQSRGNTLGVGASTFGIGNVRLQTELSCLKPRSPLKLESPNFSYGRVCQNKAIKMGKSKLERARICHRVAKRYLEHSQGAGLDKEDKKAVFYYQKAAILATEVFGAEAYSWMAYWGEKYYSDAQTLEWCLEAIGLGNTEFYTYVGRSYYEGRGCVQNYQKALEYFQKAIAIKENYEAYFALAEMYFEGEGVPQDYSKALAYYTKALGGRYKRQEVFRRLSQIYEKGLGVEPDLKKAFEYLKESCEVWHWGD